MQYLMICCPQRISHLIKSKYLVKNQKEVSGKVAPYREAIEQTRTRFEEIQGGYRAGKYDTAGRNLMVEGLFKRLLEQIDAD